MTFNEVIKKYEDELVWLNKQMQRTSSRGDTAGVNYYYGQIASVRGFLRDLESLKWDYT